MFLILLAVAALIRLFIQYQIVIITVNRDYLFLNKSIFVAYFLFSIPSTVFFYYFLSIIYTISYGFFSRYKQWFFIIALTSITVVDKLWGNMVFRNYGVSITSNLIIRLIVYVSLGYTLIRALGTSSPQKKPMLQFAAVYFSLETVSIIISDCFKLLRYADSIEYLVNIIILFIFVIPFLNTMYPKKEITSSRLNTLMQTYGFSDREMSIIQLICDGKLNKEIADQLGLAENTIKSHIFNIYKKLNVKNRVELVKHLIV